MADRCARIVRCVRQVLVATGSYEAAMFELQSALSAADPAAHRDVIGELTLELERLEACMKGKGTGDSFYSHLGNEVQDGSLRNLMPIDSPSNYV